MKINVFSTFKAAIEGIIEGAAAGIILSLGLIAIVAVIVAILW